MRRTIAILLMALLIGCAAKTKPDQPAVEAKPVKLTPSEEGWLARFDPRRVWESMVCSYRLLALLGPADSTHATYRRPPSLGLAGCLNR